MLPWSAEGAGRLFVQGIARALGDRLGPYGRTDQVGPAPQIINQAPAPALGGGPGTAIAPAGEQDDAEIATALERARGDLGAEGAS